MFEQSFVQPASRVRTGWSLMTSFGLQALMVTAALAIPLVNPEMLPKALMQIALVAPPGPPPGPPPETPRLAASNRTRTPRPATHALIEPTTMPAKPEILIDEPESHAAIAMGPGVDGGIGAAGGGGNSDFVRSLLTVAKPTQAPPAKVEPRAEPPRPHAAPITVSKGVQEGMILVKTIPVYPPIALTARIEGVVHLTAMISRDGAVTQLKAISGHPILVPAALDAVRQWRYRPTLLNGVPVEVITQVEVRFSLTR